MPPSTRTMQKQEDGTCLSNKREESNGGRTRTIREDSVTTNTEPNGMRTGKRGAPPLSVESLESLRHDAIFKAVTSGREQGNARHMQRRPRLIASHRSVPVVMSG